MHGVLASTDHITYKKSTLHNFFQFWENVKIYELRENARLTVTTFIDPVERERLVATDRPRLDNGKFFSLSSTELYTLMQSEFKPVDKIDFMKKLEANVEFVSSAHYRPTPEYFKPFYDALLVFIAKFTKVYEILVHDCADVRLVIPRCENKPGGLVKAFVMKIPYEYGTNVLLLLDNHKWPDIYAFLKDFQAVIEEHKSDSERARKLRRTFGGTQYEAKKFDQKLQHLQELRALPADPEGNDEHLKEAVEAEGEKLDEEIDTMIAALQQPPGKTPPRKTLFAKDAPPRDPLVCITKLLHGTCTKSPCNYSHKEDLVNKKRHEFIELIQKQLAAQRAQRLAVMEDFKDTYDEEY
jgi:hypothetical protein